tara:strand:+ start:3037 stop:3285 length:249 start_codon:yes stop_codon:yes gene_type:complete
MPESTQDDLIAWLFSQSPRNDAEEAILDEHIRKESERIREAWSEEVREQRAMRAGSPCREEARVPMVKTTKAFPLAPEQQNG